MNIYILTDLEGASGLWKKEQVFPNFAADYEYGKRCLVADVNTVADAAFVNGAKEIVVCDGHGPGALNWDEVDSRVGVERIAMPGAMFAGMDEKQFDCVFILGQHAMAGTQKAFLEHTQSSMKWFEFKINGQPAGEMSQFACYVGDRGLPMAMVAGDRAACVEAERLFPSVVTAEVKFARVRNVATCYPRDQVHALLREKTVQAMEKVRAGAVKPWVLKKPYQLELTFQRVEDADAWRPPNSTGKRIGSRTVQWQADTPY